MKIYSDFKDYYDSMIAYDTDETPVYRRFSKTVDFTNPQGPTSSGNRTFSAEQQTSLRHINDILGVGVSLPPALYSSRGFIAFCGKAYPFWRVRLSVGNLGNVIPKPIYGHAYTIKQYISLLQKIDTVSEHKVQTQKDVELAIDIASNRASAGKHIPEIGTYDYSRQRPMSEVTSWRTSSICKSFTSFWLSEARHLQQALPVKSSIFNDMKVPAFASIGSRAIYNPCLRDFDFAKALDVNQAWQNLSMYLGNEMADVNTVAPRPISDQLRAETHGFDRQSFRKAKGGRDKLDRSNW